MTLLLASVPALASEMAEPERERLDGPDRIHAQMRLPLGAGQLLTLLETPCHVRQWMPDLEEIRILEQPAPGQTLVYMATRTPWPLAPRDAVTLFRRESEDPVTLTMEARPRAMPERSGHVRIPFTEGRWLLRPDHGHTMLGYEQRVDPGGRLPQWAADRAAVDRVATTMENLRDYVETILDTVPAGMPGDAAADIACPGDADTGSGERRDRSPGLSAVAGGPTACPAGCAHP